MFKNKTVLSYASLLLVVFLWGVAPLFLKYLFDFYSPSAATAFRALIAALILLFYCRKKLKLLDRSYFKVAVPTGLFLATASVLQKIGLNYTTPMKYAFLENLSCVVVPFLTFIFVKKKPSFFSIAAAITCLLSAAVLSGIVNLNGFKFGFGNFGVGELLCALAGVFYGVNIAGTGAFAKKLDSGLYVMIHMFLEFAVSAITAVVVNFITVNGAPFEPFYFSLDILPLFLLIATAVVFSAVCWIIRTAAMKHVNATAVAVIMPFSAIITSVSSIITGYDDVSLALTVGAILGIIAIAVSATDDVMETKRFSVVLSDSPARQEQPATGDNGNTEKSP